MRNAQVRALRLFKILCLGHKIDCIGVDRLFHIGHTFREAIDEEMLQCCLAIGNNLKTAFLIWLDVQLLIEVRNDYGSTIQCFRILFGNRRVKDNRELLLGILSLFRGKSCIYVIHCLFVLPCATACERITASLSCESQLGIHLVYFEVLRV